MCDQIEHFIVCRFSNLKENTPLRKVPKLRALRFFFEKKSIPLAYIKGLVNQVVNC